MSRLRSAVAVVGLAVVLFAALPGALAAQRGAEQLSAIASVETPGESLVGSLLGWARSAFSWFRAITAAEHGHITQTPVVPPTTP